MLVAAGAHAYRGTIEQRAAALIKIKIKRVLVVRLARRAVVDQKKIVNVFREMETLAINSNKCIIFVGLRTRLTP